MQTKTRTIVKIEEKPVLCKICRKELEAHALISMELCNSCKMDYLNDVDIDDTFVPWMERDPENKHCPWRN